MDKSEEEEMPVKQHFPQSDEVTDPSLFYMESQLEDFLIENWDKNWEKNMS